MVGAPASTVRGLLDASSPSRQSLDSVQMLLDVALGASNGTEDGEDDPDDQHDDADGPQAQQLDS